MEQVVNDIQNEYNDKVIIQEGIDLYKKHKDEGMYE